MNSKRFLYMTTFFLVLIIVTFGIINLFLYKVPQSTIWVDNCFIKKDNYANSIENKKIVFTSGSNTLYGMQTSLIEVDLNIPVVNMAIHAGLKTDYILYRAKQVLKSNDIIIIPFEYQNFTWDGIDEGMRRDYILTHDKKFFIKELNFAEKLTMIYSASPSNLIKSFKEQLLTTKEAVIGSGYTSVTLNKNGDETYKEGTKRNFATKPFLLPTPYSKETYGLLKIKEFAQWCEQKDIKLFMTFPNTVKLKEYYNEPYISYFDFLIDYFKKNNIKVIGKPTDSLYPIEYFYDTAYHMNTKGSEIRTYEFLSKLKEQIL